MTTLATWIGYASLTALGIIVLAVVVDIIRESLNSPARVRYRVGRKQPTPIPGQDVDVYGGATDEGDRAVGLWSAAKELDAAAERVQAAWLRVRS